MMTLFRISRALVLAAALAACETQAAVTDVGFDHVRVQANGDDLAPVNEAGARACANYRRRPVSVSWRCLDAYCIYKEYLFSCVD